jgi:hypothetical protein
LYYGYYLKAIISEVKKLPKFSVCVIFLAELKIFEKRTQIENPVALVHLLHT